MTSLRSRLILVSVLVAFVSVAAVGVAAARLTAARFDAFIGHMPQAGPQARQMMRGMMGGPERRLFEDLQRAIWFAAVIGLGVAAVAGTVTARQITAPLQALATGARRIGRGDLSHDVPITGTDEIAEMARTFNAMAADLRRAEDGRRELLADIAHELGTPLAVLQANLEGMLDGVVEITPGRLSSLHTQTKVLTRLVRDLRDLSLLREGALRLDRQPVDLARVAREVVETSAAAANEKGVSVIVAAPIPVIVAVDAERVAQVLHNLVSNALRHTERGGAIRVTVTVSGADGQVEVADTGSGIPAGDLPYVFDRFHRVDRSRSRVTGGAGLGLAIVKQLVEAHGGRVWVRSVEGQGSTFGFTVPVGAREPVGLRGD
jgi:signal transduction histidine kinase